MRLPTLRTLYDFAASAPERRAAVLLAISAATIGGPGSANTDWATFPASSA